MDIKNEKQIVITLKDKDADNFISAINKIVKGENQIGFSKINISKSEFDVIKRLNDKT